MATVNVVCERGGLADAIASGAAVMLISSKDEADLQVGLADNEIGKYFDGIAYLTSAVYVGLLQGKRAWLMMPDGSIEAISIWPVAAVPHGSKVTAAVVHLEDPGDDGHSLDNVFGPNKGYYKYTLTY